MHVRIDAIYKEGLVARDNVEANIKLLLAAPPTAN
jgi:hypothetical protein